MGLIDIKEKVKKEISKTEAIAKLIEWGEFLENDTEEEHFENVIESLWKAVQKGKLDFDFNNQVFTLRLFNPIEMRDGSSPIEVVKIRQVAIGEKKDVKYKENQLTEWNIAMIALACDIEIGFAERIKPIDQNRIMAVLFGFFEKAAWARRTD